MLPLRGGAAGRNLFRTKWPNPSTAAYRDRRAETIASNTACVWHWRTFRDTPSTEYTQAANIIYEQQWVHSMPESWDSIDNTTEFGNTAYGTPDLHTYYANKPQRRAPWYERLQYRRITGRKVALYALTAAILLLSSPIAPTFVLGSLMAAAGIALRIWTFGHLAKNDSLITTGPYAYTRNPAYLGSFLIFCGIVLAAGNPYSTHGLVIWGIGLVVMVAFFHHYMPRKYAREYTRLEKMFPEEFEEHAANVPDFFPRITPWRSGDSHTFSWTSVRANHELWWPAILVTGLAVIWLSEYVLVTTAAGLALAV